MTDTAYGPAIREMLWSGFAKLSAPIQVRLVCDALSKMTEAEQSLIAKEMAASLQPHLLRSFLDALDARIKAETNA